MRARKHLLRAAAAAAASCAPMMSALAQSDDCIVGKVAKEVSQTCLSAADFESRLDLTVPANALFALMGASPDNVIRPVPGEKITASFLPDLADALGNKQAGFAVEVRPALFITPDRYTYGELQGVVQPLDGSSARTEKLKRAKNWAPFTATLAVSRGEEGVQPERAGFGMNYNYDSADPMFSTKYGDCLNDRAGPLDDQAADQAMQAVRQGADLAAEEARKRVKDQAQPGQTAAQVEMQAKDAAEEAAAKINGDSALLQAEIEKAYLPLKAKIDGIVDACARESSPWNRKMLAAGLAVYRSSPTDAAVEAENGIGVWLSKSFKLGPSGQLIAHARHTDDLLQESAIAGVTALRPTDNTSIGLRYTHSVTGDGPNESLSSDVVRAIVEVGSVKEKIEGQPADDYWQVGLGAEFRLQRNLYFQVMFGDAKGSIQDRDEFFNGQIKWSFSSSRAQ